MPEIKLTEGVLKTLSTTKRQEEFYDLGFNAAGSFGVRISEGGRKVFFYIYSIAGRRRRMTLGSHPTLSLHDARGRALSVVKQLASGRDPAREGRHTQQAGRVAEVIDRFLEHRSVIELADKTRTEYARILQNEIQPRWGERLVESIGGRDVVALLAEVADDRGSPVMAARIRALLSKLFNFARQRGLIEQNPVSKTALPPEPPKSIRLLTIDQLREIWRLASDEPAALRAVFRLLILTGQRPSDVLSMRWSDISLEAWTLTRTNPLPLVREAREILAPLQQKTHGTFVFPSDEGIGPKRGHIVSLRRATKRIMKRMTPGSPPWSALDIRRSVEAHLIAQGTRPEITERLMNRRSLLSRLPTSSGSFDYDREMRRALERYTQRLLPAPPRPKQRPQGSEQAKVIPLFPVPEE